MSESPLRGRKMEAARLCILPLVLVFLSLNSVFSLQKQLRSLLPAPTKAFNLLSLFSVSSDNFPTFTSVRFCELTSSHSITLSNLRPWRKSKPRSSSLVAHATTLSTSSTHSVTNHHHYEPDRSVAKSTTIFVGNLPFSSTELEIETIIKENMGENLVKNIQLIRGEKTKRPLGYAFIHFHEHHIALQGVEFFNGLMYGDRTLNSNMKDPDEAAKSSALKKKKQKDRKYHLSIYLSNLDYSLTEQELINMCDDILGPDLVDYVNIPLDIRSKSPKGYAQIQFKTMDAVEKALVEFNGLDVFNRLLKCDRLKPPKEIGKKVPKEVQNDSGNRVGDEDITEFFDDNFDTR